MRSMTGYGAAQGRLEGWDVSVMIKAVNHRGLDVRVHLLRAWGWLEPSIQEYIKSLLYRGRVDVHVDLSRADTGEVDLHIDERAFGEVCRALDALAERHGLARPVRMAEALEFKHAFERGVPDSAPSLDAEALMELVAQAAQALLLSREREGGAIHAELSARRERLLDDVDRVRLMRPRLLDRYRERVRDRLEEL
ncbi:MAG: YicC/YloC family endoribonuclease, partial [Myxococcota bacterium]